MLTLMLTIVIVLVIAGLILWAVTQVPLDPAIQRMIHVVVIVCCVIFLIYELVSVLNGNGNSNGPVLNGRHVLSMLLCSRF
jgi:thiosulfate reductase cytochrome b subunit